MSMEYRQLGATELQVSTIGFGAAPLGDVYGKVDVAETTAAVHEAIDSGITLFDVSPYYGLTLAESRLGEALVGYRDKVVLATKCGRYGASEFDFSAASVTKSCEDSLQRLKTDRLDILQAHDVEFGDADQVVNETIPALRRLQEQGKVRVIGITGLSLKNLAAIARRAHVDCMITYCRYNLMISDMDDVLLPVAEERGIGVINASPLHMGVLTEDGVPEWHPSSLEIRAVGRQVVELCKARGVSAPLVALRYCLDHSYVSSTLVGMASRELVRANLKALEFSIDPELLVEIQRLVAPVHNQIWDSGLAENRG
ncbi:aldo/keto reductase [Granulicella paludicola]|uniref:aldo/keto reductase n=1 Tax=Granulicella paludicola TaxID=474951 RepID=UPI0021DF76BC|nr:aldo/keto reductase [Granulicella paludicola]